MLFWEIDPQSTVHEASELTGVATKLVEKFLSGEVIGRTVVRDSIGLGPMLERRDIEGSKKGVICPQVVREDGGRVGWSWFRGQC